MIDKPGKTDIVAATVALNSDLSDLRTRIAAVLGSYLADDLQPGHASMVDAADAVIAELQLATEFGCPVPGHHFCRCSHRHTTKWENNDDD